MIGGAVGGSPETVAGGRRSGLHRDCPEIPADRQPFEDSSQQVRLSSSSQVVP